MPFKYTTIAEENIVHVEVSGAFDLKSSVDAIVEVANELHGCPSCSVLIDFRNAEYSPNPSELKSISQALINKKREVKFTGKVAVLVAREREVLYTALCTVLHVWGFIMKPFTNLVEAKKYLKSQQTSTSK